MDRRKAEGMDEFVPRGLPPHAHHLRAFSTRVHGNVDRPKSLGVSLLKKISGGRRITHHTAA